MAIVDVMAQSKYQSARAGPSLRQTCARTPGGSVGSIRPRPRSPKSSIVALQLRSCKFAQAELYAILYVTYVRRLCVHAHVCVVCVCVCMHLSYHLLDELTPKLPSARSSSAHTNGTERDWMIRPFPTSETNALPFPCVKSSTEVHLIHKLFSAPAVSEQSPPRAPWPHP